MDLPNEGSEEIIQESGEIRESITVNILPDPPDSYDEISLGVDIASCILTTILTIIIIVQTYSLNKKQQKLEEKINEEQEKLQKRQLKLDSYPYRREVYVHTFAVIHLCHALTENFSEADLLKKSCDEIEKIFRTIQKQYVPDMSEAMWSMREAEYIFSKNTAKVILDIRDNFDLVATRMTAPEMVEAIIKDTGLELDSAIEEMKQKNVHTALECCNKILGYTDYIEKVLTKELSISGLDK